MSNIHIINPIEYPGWDDLILSTEDYSFFHSAAWAKVLHESYGYKPEYFTIFSKNQISTLIPLMSISSMLTGHRAVSLPFSDHCKPILSDSHNFQETWDYLRKHGEKSRWKYIELRDVDFLSPEIQPFSSYYRHTLKLSQNQDEIFKSFRGSTKRNIKKATKQGVEVRISNSIGAVKEFCRLNCLTRKKHGLPPQPFYFFNKVFDHIISKNQGFIVLAYYKKEIIAGNVYFHFGEKAIYKYGASNTQHQHLRASNIVMWEAIKWYCQSRYKTFCFGRSEVDNQGLLQFKSGWGTKQEIIKYYKYNLHKQVFANEKSTSSNTRTKIFCRMPIPLLKMIGSALYPHMG